MCCNTTHSWLQINASLRELKFWQGGGRREKWL